MESDASQYRAHSLVKILWGLRDFRAGLSFGEPLSFGYTNFPRLTRQQAIESNPWESISFDRINAMHSDHGVKKYVPKATERFEGLQSLVETMRVPWSLCIARRQRQAWKEDKRKQGSTHNEMYMEVHH